MTKETKEVAPPKLPTKDEFLGNALSQVINNAIFTTMKPVVIGEDLFAGAQLFKVDKLMNAVRPYLDACYKQGIVEAEANAKEVLAKRIAEDALEGENKGDNTDAKSRDTGGADKQDDAGGTTPENKGDPSGKDAPSKGKGSVKKGKQAKNEEPQKSH